MCLLFRYLIGKSIASNQYGIANHAIANDGIANDGIDDPGVSCCNPEGFRFLCFDGSRRERCIVVMVKVN